MSSVTDEKLMEEYQELLKKEKNINEELELWRKKSTPKYEMTLLHKYNEIKDATQVLLGAIANIEGVTVKEVHEQFNLPLKD